MRRPPQGWIGTPDTLDSQSQFTPCRLQMPVSSPCSPLDITDTVLLTSGQSRMCGGSGRGVFWLENTANRQYGVISTPTYAPVSTGFRRACFTDGQCPVSLVVRPPHPCEMTRPELRVDRIRWSSRRVHGSHATTVEATLIPDNSHGDRSFVVDRLPEGTASGRQVSAHRRHAPGQAHRERESRNPAPYEDRGAARSLVTSSGGGRG